MSKNMFKPNFSYTTHIVNNLLKITSAREIILHAYLVPKWDVALRKEALVRNAHSSTSIEGNRLSLEQVTDLAAGREVMATTKDKQEVINYLYVLEHLADFAEHENITEKTILNLHKRIAKYALGNPKDSGKYRNRQVYVGDGSGNVIFMPPKTEDVPKLMRSLVAWLNSEDTKKLDPVLVAGIAHYEFVRIHPFIDGNGRTARALASLILLLRGFDIKRFFALDDYYDSDRNSYYAALQAVNQKTLDLNKWLEYFTDGVAVSVNSVKERILRLSSEKLRKDLKGQIALTERQMKIIEHLQSNKKITAGDVAKFFKITRQAALKELFKLVELGVIELKGKGRGAHYVLV